MCFYKRPSSGTLKTFKLFCVFCAIVPSMSGHFNESSHNQTSRHHGHHHHQQHAHLSLIAHANDYSEINQTQLLSPTLINLSTSARPVTTGGNASKTNGDVSQFNRLHRFNRRFESMRQCKLPGSSCQCLWNLNHLRGMLQVENSTDKFHGLASSSRSGSMSEGYGAHGEGDGSLQRQLAVIMLANVLRMAALRGSEQTANQNRTGVVGKLRWFKCVPTESICQFAVPKDRSEHLSPYATERQQILTTLMPNMAKVMENNESDHEEEHQDSGNKHDHSDDLLGSIELLTDIESLLRQMHHQLAIDQMTAPQVTTSTSNKCFDREDILDELRQHSPEIAKSAHHHHETLNLLYIEHLANFIVKRLASGECIELFETKFLRDIISRYGTESVAEHETVNSEHNQSTTAAATLAIHQDGFVKLLNDLHIGGLIENNEIERRVDHDEQDHDSHQHQHHSLHQHELKPSASTRGHRSISTTVPFANSHNHIGHHHTHHHPPRSSACLDYRYYLHRQGDSKVLTANDLRELSPIFIQQILSGACEQLESSDHIVPIGSATSKLLHTDMNATNVSLNSTSHDHHGHGNHDEAWKVYIYSSIAVFIISISSICGVLLIPFLKSQYYSHLINLLIGLAFGSMAGDALFHLLPTVLGIHSHGSSEDSHDHGEEAQGRHKDHDQQNGDYMWLMMAILGTIYALFLFEIISHFWASKTKRKGANSSEGHDHSHNHGHSHVQPNYQKSQHIDNKSTVPTLLTKVTSTDNDQMDYSSNLTISSTLTNQSNDQEEHQQALQLYKSPSQASMTVPEPDRDGASAKDKTPIFFGMTSLALIVTIGDSIHNLLDGVAIGIAFSNSIASGISTSIAVFCHELPHEFGDFAVLLSTGLSVRRAAVINFLSALTAFIGLYIGILLGNNDAANRWALAICAGLFLYVALVDMLPELKEMPSIAKGNCEWITSLLVKNAGILLGVGFMVILAKYEELLNFA